MQNIQNLLKFALIIEFVPYDSCFNFTTKNLVLTLLYDRPIVEIRLLCIWYIMQIITIAKNSILWPIHSKSGVKSLRFKLFVFTPIHLPRAQTFFLSEFQGATAFWTRIRVFVFIRYYGFWRIMNKIFNVFFNFAFCFFDCFFTSIFFTFVCILSLIQNWEHHL